MAQSFLLHRGKQQAASQPRLTAALAFVETALLRAVWWVCARLGPDRAGAICAMILGLIGPRLAKTAHLRRNLQVALPELGEAELRPLVRDAWRETGRVLGEFPRLGTICKDEAEERLEIVQHYDMGPVSRGERHAIFVSGHFANWELAAGCSQLVRFPLSVLYSPQGNSVADAMVQKHRRALGVGLVPRQQAARGMMRAIRGGQNFGVLLDQRYDDGVPVPFFGHETPSGIAAAQLAAKLGVDYVPVRIERLSGARFRITFHEAIPPDPSLPDTQSRAVDMTRRAYALFEEWIRERPDQWLCLKRRWPREVYRRLGMSI